jgi:hypothetical protein
MIGRFARAMLKQRQDLAPLYRNAFAYNRRLVTVLFQMINTSNSMSQFFHLAKSSRIMLN